ncbi:MAG: hypothetical protein MMC23_006348 [Stictis urceolatum]|nr:hypothetical protein [Stictis urceolata]
MSDSPRSGSPVHVEKEDVLDPTEFFDVPLNDKSLAQELTEASNFDGSGSPSPDSPHANAHSAASSGSSSSHPPAPSVVDGNDEDVYDGPPLTRVESHSQAPPPPPSQAPPPPPSQPEPEPQSESQAKSQPEPQPESQSKSEPKSTTAESPHEEREDDAAPDHAGPIPYAASGLSEIAEETEEELEKLSIDGQILALKHKLFMAQATVSNAQNELSATRSTTSHFHSLYNQSQVALAEARSRAAKLDRLLHDLQTRMLSTSKPPPSSNKRMPLNWMGGSWLSMASVLPVLEPAEAAFKRGRHQEALALLHPLANDRALDNSVRLYSYILSAVVMRCAGEVRRATSDLARVLKLAQRFGDTQVLALLFFHLGLCYFYENRPTEACMCFAHSKGLEGYEELLAVNLGMATEARDRLDEGDDRRVVLADFLGLVDIEPHVEGDDPSLRASPQQLRVSFDSGKGKGKAAGQP